MRKKIAGCVCVAPAHRRCSVQSRPRTSLLPSSRPPSSLHPHQVDAEIIRLFSGDCEALLRGEYDGWQAGRPEEALAGIIIGG